MQDWEYGSHITENIFSGQRNEDGQNLVNEMLDMPYDDDFEDDLDDSPN